MNYKIKAQNFNDIYQKLGETDKKSFARVANKLLSINYIVRRNSESNEDYYFIIANIDCFKSYFYILDYEVYYEEADQVIYIRNQQNYNHRKFKKIESVILLVLRKLFFQKMQEVSLVDEVVIKVEEVHEAINATSVLDRRITKQEFAESFRLFKRYNLCAINGNLELDDTIIFLYKSLLYAIPLQNIEQLEKKILEYQRGENKDEDLDESKTD